MKESIQSNRRAEILDMTEEIFRDGEYRLLASMTPEAERELNKQPFYRELEKQLEKLREEDLEQRGGVFLASEPLDGTLKWSTLFVENAPWLQEMEIYLSSQSRDTIQDQAFFRDTVQFLEHMKAQETESRSCGIEDPGNRWEPRIWEAPIIVEPQEGRTESRIERIREKFRKIFRRGRECS